MTILSRQELMSFMKYDKKSGKLLWIKRPANRSCVGAEVGYKNGQGYREVELRGKVYQAHRLIWLFVYGIWPDKEVDHINSNKSDNNLENLRLATKSQNQHNRKRWSKGTSSKFKGVCFHKISGKWTADIQCNGKRRHLGLFEKEYEAGNAYRMAAIVLHGEFARP